MANLGDRFRDLGTLDALQSLDSPVHRLDPRAKVLATLAFVVTVASFGRHEVSALLPFAFFPLTVAARGGIPSAYLAKRILVALPFALLLGAFDPLLDRQPLMRLGSLGIAGGWLSLASTVLRLALAVAAAVTLAATTGLGGVCLALERLRLPRIFVVQIALLHRYAFVLAEEAGRMLRARELRAHGRPLAPAAFGPLAGHLLLRTWDRAQRIHRAMLARGFEGSFHAGLPLEFHWRDAGFLAGWSILFLVFRCVHVPGLLGRALTGGLP